VDQARSRELGGTGLGLAIVKHVMNLHNGSVSVESQEGKGSVFTLIFPLA
jgi:two-component system phosphate regulon sensor histidine kinase PhoR